MLRVYRGLSGRAGGRIETSINACYRLQRGVSRTSTVLGTPHPNFPIREELIEFQKVFRTPIFDPDSVATNRGPMANGTRTTVAATSGAACTKTRSPPPSPWLTRSASTGANLKRDSTCSTAASGSVPAASAA